MIELEQNYRALLEKLIRFRDETAELRLALKQRVDTDQTLRPGQRLALRAKVKVLGGQLSRLDFMLARNRREIAAFGLKPAEHSAFRVPHSAQSRATEGSVTR